MKKKLLIAISLMLILSLTFTGCGKTQVEPVNEEPANEQEQPKQGEEEGKEEAKEVESKIVYGLWSSPTGVFNPVLYDEEYDAAVIQLVFSTLLKLDKELNLVPCLAEGFNISEDNLSITFNLRKDVKWHDGAPFTSKDVEFTFTSMAHPDYTGPRYGEVEKLVGAAEFHEGNADRVEGIKVLDDYTIEFTFKEVFAPGLIRIGADRGIIPKHVWENVPVKEWKEKAQLLNNPIGTGAYKIVEFVPGQFVQLEAYNDFYDGKAETEKFIFKVSNQDTAIAELVNGEIDIADISSLKADDISSLKDAGIAITSYPGKSYQYMGFNLRDKTLQNKKLRQAMFYAIDRETIVDKLMDGNGMVLNAPLVPTGWAYPKTGLNEYKYDPEKAKALLKEAGYEDKNNDGYLDKKNGETLEFVLKYPIGNKTREQSAPVIQKYLKDVGIKLELRNMEFGALLDEVMSNHEFDMYLLGSSLSLDPDPKPIWHSDAASDEKGNAAWNIVGFRNKEADEVIVNGLKVLKISERQKNYQKFCEIVNEEAPQVFLYAPKVVKAYNPSINNFEPGTYRDYFEFEKWHK